MKIESVAVLGAGAVGSYVIWGLSEKAGVRLGVVAEGERAERIEKELNEEKKLWEEVRA